MNWENPAVLAAIASGLISALLSGSISLYGIIRSSRTAKRIHDERLDFERNEGKRKTDADIALAKEKFALDRQAADWKRLVELVEPALADFYSALNAITWARSPQLLLFGDEGGTRPRAEGETEADARRRDMLYIPIERLNHKSELFGRLAVARFRFQANFGVEGIHPFDDLTMIRVDIKSAVEDLLREQRRGRRSEEHHDEWEAIVGLGGADEDPIAPRIDAAVRKMEAICQRILGQRPVSSDGQASGHT